MNPSALASFNEQALETAEKHKSSFNMLIRDSSNSGSAKETALLLLEKLLPRIREWAEQRILVLPRDVVKDAFTAKDGAGNEQPLSFLQGAAAINIWKEFQVCMKTRLRHEVEQDDSLVQIVGCGVVVHGDSLFLLRRSSKDEKTSYGRSVLWKGCHIEGEQAASLDEVAAQVKNRVLEEFHLRTELQSQFSGMVWTETVPPESRHLGILFLARLEDESVARSMQDKEFRKAGRGHIMTGKFQTPKQILESLDELGLEAWSRFAVENIGLQEPG